MPRYRVTKKAAIRRNLMPVGPKNTPVTCGTVTEGETFTGAPLGNYVQIQEPNRSGFVSKTVVEELPNEQS